MTFGQLFAIIRARWIIAVGVFALVVTAVGLFTWFMPRTYTATASVLVDIRSADPIAGGVSPGVMAPSYLLTQIDVMTSMRVAQRVVTKLKLTEVPALRQKWQDSTGGTGDFQGYVAQIIRSNLDARPSRGSNVIMLQYQASDPAFAAAIVNAFVNAYLEISMNLRTDPAKQYGDFFDANVKKLRERLQASQARLSEFQQKNGLVVNDERMDVENARLNELAQSYVNMQTAVADSESRRNVVNQQGRNTQDVMGSPLVASLKSDVVRQEAALGQMSTKLGDNHPQVIEARASLDQLRSKLEAEISRVTTSVNLNNNINVSRASQVNVALEAQRAKVLKMKQLRDEAVMLQHDVDHAQRAFDGVMARQSLNSLESQALLSNVAALEMAPVPSVPSSPRTLVNMALGLLVGGMAALGAALLRERFDRRLRTVTDVESLVDLPVVASIPSFKPGRRKLALSVPLSERFRLGGGGGLKTIGQ